MGLDISCKLSLNFTCFSQKNRICHFKQNVSLHKMSNPYKSKKTIISLSSVELISSGNGLTLLLLNTTCLVLANSVDPDQLASEEAN